MQNVMPYLYLDPGNLPFTEELTEQITHAKWVRIARGCKAKPSGLVWLTITILWMAGRRQNPLRFPFRLTAPPKKRS